MPWKHYHAVVDATDETRRDEEQAWKRQARGRTIFPISIT